MYHLKVNNNVLRRLMVCVLFLALVGCNGATTTPTKPVDIAAETGKQISKAFLLTYDVAKNLTENGTEVQKEFALTKLNPAVNQAKHAVVAFDTAVAIWQRTGSEGANVLTNQKELEKIYDNLQKLIVQAFALAKGV
jgi:hypothetical protein